MLEVGADLCPFISIYIRGVAVPCGDQGHCPCWGHWGTLMGRVVIPIEHHPPLTSRSDPAGTERAEPAERCAVSCRKRGRWLPDPQQDNGDNAETPEDVLSPGSLEQPGCFLWAQEPHTSLDTGLVSSPQTPSLFLFPTLPFSSVLFDRALRNWGRKGGLMLS